jgi:hypothetical protein
MLTESVYVIPCLCGVDVLSHACETTCPECGRILIVEWGGEKIGIATLE